MTVFRETGVLITRRDGVANKGHSTRVLSTANTHQTTARPNPEQPATRFESTVRHIRRIEDQIAILTKQAARLRDQAMNDVVFDLGGRKAKTLSSREKQVIKLLCDDKINKEIAAELGIAVRTVKFHVSALMSKCGVDSRYKLAALFRFDRFAL